MLWAKLFLDPVRHISGAEFAGQVLDPVVKRRSNFETGSEELEPTLKNFERNRSKVAETETDIHLK